MVGYRDIQGFITNACVLKLLLTLELLSQARLRFFCSFGLDGDLGVGRGGLLDAS